MNVTLRAFSFAMVLLSAPCCFGATIEKLIPFATADRVRIQTTIRGDNTPGRIELRAKIATAGGAKATLWEGPLGAIDAAAGAQATSDKIIENLKPNLWTPATPNLYELTVTATRGGRSVASQTVRIGFRTFEAKDGHFYLNGKPIFLRGLAISPPGRTVPKETTDQRAFAEAYVKYLRGQNVNLIRLSDESQMWFDVCDELGMMVYQGTYASPPSGLSKAEEAALKALEKAAKPAPKEGDSGDDAGDDNVADPGAMKLLGQAEGGGKKLPKDFEKSFNAYKAMFETYARHPSIVIYILSNEMPYKGESGKLVHDFLTKMHARLRQWDDTHPYIANAGYGEGREGDINDVHRYWGWYYNTFATFLNIRDAKLFGEFEKNQPLTFSECVGNFTGPSGAYNCIERKQLAAQLGWTGHAGDQAEQAQEYQGFTVKQVTEMFRRLRSENARISGLMPFTITFHNWRGVRTFDQMKPTAAAKQFGISYQPVLLSWENWQPQVYAGATIRPIAHVINDSEDFQDLVDIKLSYALRDRQNKAVLERTMAAPDIPYFGAATKLVELNLPTNLPSGAYVLVGRILDARGKVVSTNDTPLFIAAADWKKPAKPGERRVVVFDPAGATLAAMKTLGIQAAAIDDVSQLRPTDCLVIGEEAWNPSLAQAKQRLAEFIKSGGRIICLGQKHETFDASWLPTEVKLAKDSVNDPTYPAKDRPTRDQMHVNPERPDHPILVGVDREQLKMWSDYSNWDETKPGFPKIYPVEYGFTLVKPDDLAHTAVIVDYDRGLEGMAIVEMFDGKGSVVLCGLDLVKRIGIDPAADRILGNMITYMSGSGPHAVHASVTQKIQWGNYPTQRGVITGPINGLFINTEFIPPPTDPTTKPGDKNTGWNTKPSDQWSPMGIRPRGPFFYTFNCSPRDGEKGSGEKHKEEEKKPGTGIFWASIPSGRRSVVNIVRNPDKEAASIEISVNNGKPTTLEIPSGKTVTLRTPIPGGATDVGVRYRGSRKLVILETSFE